MSTDPFEALRLADDPVQPSAAFAATLRARIESALGLSVTPLAATRPIVAGTVTPYLTCNGAAAALDFYVRVLGAVEVGQRYIDQSDGRLGHAEFVLGASRLMLSDEYPDIGVLSPTTLGGTSFALSAPVHDVDAVFADAVAAGARGVREPADQPYGMRSGAIIDPWGHRWLLESPIGDRAIPELTGFDLQPAGDAAPAPLDPIPVTLGYFSIRVGDIQRAATFFSRLFQWQIEPGGHIANVDPPAGLVDVGDDVTTLYFQVPDLAATLQQVRELGGSVVSVADYESGPNARCTDDQGTIFELYQPNPGYQRS